MVVSFLVLGRLERVGKLSVGGLWLQIITEPGADDKSETKIRVDAVRVHASLVPRLGRRFHARVVRVWSVAQGPRAGVGSVFALEGRAEPNSRHTGPMWFSYVNTDGHGTHGAACMHQDRLGSWRGRYLRVVNADPAAPTTFSTRNIQWIRADRDHLIEPSLQDVVREIVAVPRHQIPRGPFGANRRLQSALNKRLLARR